MPGMALFSSRRRGNSASRPPPPSTHSAALAAASAVTGSRPHTSHGALSSAAAAAALRSATTTPEPIGSIQTKRMARRGSQSSTGSARGGLQRRDSAGSMSERTFRSPSPGREHGRTSTLAPPPDVPPVPAVPKNLSPAHHQRSSSLGPPPQRGASPAARNARALSVDRARQPPPISTRDGNQLSEVAEELERSTGNRNVNYSRPIASPPQSPTTPPSPAANPTHYTHGTGAWFSEPVPELHPPRSEPQADALTAKMARVQAAQGQPVHHTNAGTSAQRLPLRAQPAVAGTAVTAITAPPPQPMETMMVYDANSRTFVPKSRPKPMVEPPSPTLPAPPQPKPGQYDPNTRSIVPAPEYAAPQQAASRPHSLALNTDVDPPRNLARVSPTSSPSSSQSLQPQPSTVHEEPEEVSGAGAGTAVSGSAQNNGQTHQRKDSLDVPSPRGAGSMRGRAGSTSPSPQRSARFSASPVIAATKHDPPARDVSPAKPALKHPHSPASSVRTNSPLANCVSTKSPPDETSDSMSHTFHDGFTGKKKKAARVSFDEQPHEIEASTAAASPKLLARDRSLMVDDLDDEEPMKPRPALPSFGSVRKNRVVAEKVTEMAPERHEGSNNHPIGGILRNANWGAQPATEPVPPEVTSEESAGYASDNSDDAVVPISISKLTPPSIGADTTIEKADTSPKSPIEPIVRDFASAVEPTQPGDATLVPQINLSPPTPGTEESNTLEDGDHCPKPRSSWEIVLPGGWEGDHEAEIGSAGAASATVAAIEQHNAVSTIEPVLTYSPEEPSPMLAAVDEDSDSDDSTAFSDAAEDLSALQGGFASLDAIAVSPLNAQAARSEQQSSSATSTPATPTTPKASKKAERAQLRNTTGQTSEYWTQATDYWSNLSKVQRERIERQHFSSDDEARPAPATRQVKNTAPQTNAKLAPATPSPPVPKSSPAHRDARPAQSSMMKKTMRAQPGPAPAPAAKPADGPVRMRRSMRDGNPNAGGGMAAWSMPTRPQPEPRGGALQKKSLRPELSGSLSASSAGAAMTQRSRKSRDSSYPRVRPRTQPQPVVSARLQNELTNDSDSESSFKKKRRGSASTVDPHGRFAMRRSMRGGPEAATPQREERRPVSPTPLRAKGKDSFGIRSLSPTRSFFGRKKQKDIRGSLRGISVDAGSTRMAALQSSQPPRPAARQAPAQPQRRNRFKSRFVDSDDSDDDALPSTGGFRSRFVDSDDDDDVELAPVRGIPRRKGQEDGDSTDLEDSDDEADTQEAIKKREKQATPVAPSPADIDKAMEAARKRLGMDHTAAQPQTPAQDNGKQGQALSQGSLRKQPEDVLLEPRSRLEEIDFIPDKKRRTFMGSILRRNRSSRHSVTAASYPQGPVPEMPSTPLVTNPFTTASPVATTARSRSPAGRGKLIRRSSNQPQPPRMKRGDSSFSTATAPPMMGQTSTTDWPLVAPPVPEIPDDIGPIKSDARPATSDGTPGQSHHANGNIVRFSDAAEQRQLYSSRAGKKKKFGMFRRVFGLDDSAHQQSLPPAAKLHSRYNV